MFASWPAARSALTILQLLPRAANAALSGGVLLGIFDPTDELVAGERCDVVPRSEGRGVGDECFAKVSGKFVHDPTGDSRAGHTTTILGHVCAATGSYR
jgi:hypothetical protein